MTDIFGLIWGAITGFFRPRVDREAEIIALRHQLNIAPEETRKAGPCQH
jgi:hypothetical protein